MFSFLIWAAGILLLAGMIFIGHRLAGFSHIKHTISELGESGSLYEKQTGFLLFFPVGILLLLAALTQWQIDHEFTSLVGLTTCVSIGYLVAAFFPCDPGSPMSGSSRQQIHNLGGLVEYGGGAYFILQMGTDKARVVGSIVLVSAVLISFMTPVRGLIQRVAEVLLFSAMLALF